MTLSIASLEAAAAETSQPFIDSTYYGEAEKWTALWWDDRLPFRAMFDTNGRWISQSSLLPDMAATPNIPPRSPSNCC